MDELLYYLNVDQNTECRSEYLKLQSYPNGAHDSRCCTTEASPAKLRRSTVRYEVCTRYPGLACCARASSN